MAKKAKALTPHDRIERDLMLAVVCRLTAVFGPLVAYNSWSEVPTFTPLPKGADSHCHECLTPHQASLYPVCG